LFRPAHRSNRQRGERILFTDRHGRSNEQIVLAYRSQSQVEDALADMKHSRFLGWEPMLHWSESNIRVHWFYCVPAPILGSFSDGALPGTVCP
jgi:transposase